MTSKTEKKQATSMIGPQARGVEGPRLKRIVIECACVDEQHSWRKDKTNHARKGPLDCSFTWVSK